MEQETSDPSIQVGSLPEDFCPSSYQELMEEFAKRYSIPTATGRAGEDGDVGQKGDPGDATSATGEGALTSAVLMKQTVSLGLGVEEVDWQPPVTVTDRSAFNFKLVSPNNIDTAKPAISYIEQFFVAGSASTSSVDPGTTPIRIHLTVATDKSDTWVEVTWLEFS